MSDLIFKNQASGEALHIYNRLGMSSRSYDRQLTPLEKTGQILMDRLGAMFMLGVSKKTAQDVSKACGSTLAPETFQLSAYFDVSIKPFGYQSASCKWAASTLTYRARSLTHIVQCCFLAVPSIISPPKSHSAVCSQCPHSPRALQIGSTAFFPVIMVYKMMVPVDVGYRTLELVRNIYTQMYSTFKPCHLHGHHSFIGCNRLGQTGLSCLNCPSSPGLLISTECLQFCVISSVSADSERN